MKCPFRVIAKEHQYSRGGDGKTHDRKDITQEFADCYGTQCAAAYVVEYNGIPKVEGCKRLMNPNCL